MIQRIRLQLRTSRPGDRGQASSEYLGVIVVVGALVAVLIGSGTGLGGQIAQGISAAICRIAGGSCQVAAAPRALPKCVTATNDKTIGLSLTGWSVKLSHDDKVSTTSYGDGKARVVTADTYGVGGDFGGGGKVDIAKFLKNGKLGGGKGLGGYAEGSITGTGAVQLAYDFPTQEAADAWVDTNRSTLGQIANFAGGPVADGLEQGVNWLGRKLGLGSPTRTRAPDAIIFEVGEQAKGSVGAGAPFLAGGSAEVSGKAAGTVELNLNDGTSKFTGSLEVGANAQVDLLSLNGKAGITGKASYSVSYDADGRPTSFTVTGEASPTLGWGGAQKGLPTGANSKIGGGASTSDGKKYVRSYSLDLRTPENQAAFTKAFVTAGPIAVPRIQSDLAATGDAFGGFVDRLGTDAIYVESTYSTKETGGSASAKGGEGVVFGGEGTYKSSGTDLVQAQYRDNAVPGSRLQPLTSCSK